MKMVSWKMLMMQDPATMVMGAMTAIHNIIMEIMTLVATFIMVLMIFLLKNKSTNRMMTQSNILEITWTLLPMMILVYMASPSLQLLYLLEEFQSPTLTVKAMGHQWYWTYEYPDFKKTFDSYLTSSNHPSKFRLMDVDNRLILPMNTYMRILCSSTDVIHSWALPSMGMKMDATPGRMNQMNMYPSFLGVFYGQCSEICGMNHSLMPIAMEIIPSNMFIEWVKNTA